MFLEPRKCGACDVIVVVMCTLTLAPAAASASLLTYELTMTATQYHNPISLGVTDPALPQVFHATITINSEPNPAPPVPYRDGTYTFFPNDITDFSGVVGNATFSASGIDHYVSGAVITPTGIMNALYVANTDAGTGISIDLSFENHYWNVDRLTATGFDYIMGDLVVTSVPLPAALWLFGSGMLGLIGVARRRSQVARDAA